MTDINKNSNMPDRLDDLKHLLAEPVYNTPSIRWAIEEIESLRTTIRCLSETEVDEPGRGRSSLADR